MKPASFDYHCPTTVAETVGLLRSLGSEAKLLAGGQSLVPLMNLRLARPGHLIDLNRVTDLVGVAESAGVLELGALLRHRTLATHPTIASRVPLLAEAAGQIGHPAIRGRGTLGGSLAHADPAGELPTVAVTLDATLVATSASATRLLAAGGFFTGPLSTTLARRSPPFGGDYASEGGWRLRDLPATRMAELTPCRPSSTKAAEATSRFSRQSSRSPRSPTAHTRETTASPKPAKRRSRKLWTPASPVTLVDVSQVVTRNARTIIREAKVQGLSGFRGADAIHLATAFMFKCDEVFTYEAEPRRARWQQIAKIPVTEPVTNTPRLDL